MGKSFSAVQKVKIKPWKNRLFFSLSFSTTSSSTSFFAHVMRTRERRRRRKAEETWRALHQHSWINQLLCQHLLLQQCVCRSCLSRQLKMHPSHYVCSLLSVLVYSISYSTIFYFFQLHSFCPPKNIARIYSNIIFFFFCQFQMDSISRQIWGTCRIRLSNPVRLLVRAPTLSTSTNETGNVHPARERETKISSPPLVGPQCPAKVQRDSSILSASVCSPAPWPSSGQRGDRSS